MADNPLLWQDLDLTSTLGNRCHLPSKYEPSKTLLRRIEHARSITATPRLPVKYVKYDTYHRWKFGEDFAYILNKRQCLDNLSMLRSLRIRSTVWDEGLLVCLPHLVNLDMSRVYIDTPHLTSVMYNLGGSLERLSLDGLHLCRSIFPLVLTFHALEYLSLSMCNMPPEVLQWFLTGFPISPACVKDYPPPLPPLGCSAPVLCNIAESTLVSSASAVMPRLKELDLKYMDHLQGPWLRQFHVVRLGLLEGSIALGSTAPTSLSPTRDIHIDVRGCKKLRLADLQSMELTWPGTRFTPSMKGIDVAGFPKHRAASALPLEALPIALRFR